MSKKNIAVIQLLTCSALWSMAGILMKFIPWPGIVIAGGRSLFAGVVAYVYMRTGGMHLVVNRRSLLSGAALAATLLLFCVSNKLTTAANAIVLQFTSPVFVMLISAVFLGKKFSKADIIAVILTFVGISLFFFDKLGSGSMLGNFTALGSGLCFGTYYVTLGTGSAEERLSSITIANILTVVVSIPFAGAAQPAVSGLTVLLVVILGVFQLGIPYVLLAMGSEYCPPLVCSLLGALEPLLNPVWVLIFDGERPGAFALMGAAVVILTITLWCLLGHRREAETI